MVSDILMDNLVVRQILSDVKTYPIMSDDCPSFLEVGGYLFIFVISSGMLLYILLYSSLLVLQAVLVINITSALIFLLVYSAYKIYKSLFPACWI